MSLIHNSYFDGKVQSVGFQRNGRKITAGVIDSGEYHFGTESAERMTITSGQVEVKIDGTATFVVYPVGTAFEIGVKSGFDIRAREPAAYVCEYL